MMCKPCAVKAADAAGVSRDAIKDNQRKCTHLGCTKQPNSGTSAEPRKWCAPHARQHWIANAVPLPNRVSSSGKMPTASRSYSRVSIECLDWHAAQLGVQIQHAESRVLGEGELDAEEALGEHLIAVSGHRWKADGFTMLRDECRVCWEFHGCAWHGCPRCFTERDNELKGKTMAERYDATLARTAEIGAAGYIVIEIWECQWEAFQEDEDARNAHLNNVRRSLGKAPVAPKRRGSTLDGFVRRARVSENAD